MKARALVAGVSFGPDALKVIGQAFDEAWNEIESSGRGRPLAVEADRLRLANIVLGLATEGARDPEPIKREALRIFDATRQNSN